MASDGGERENVKRRAILDAARAIFLTHGYEAASMDAITREAGVSKATLYAHFGSKHALFGAMVSERCAESFADLWADWDAVERDPRAALLEFGRRFMALTLSPETLALYRVIAHESQRFPELGQAVFEAGPRRVTLALTQRLAGWCAGGRLVMADPELAARLLLGMMHNHVFLRAVFNVIDLTTPEAQEETRRVVEAAVELFLASCNPK